MSLPFVTGQIPQAADFNDLASKENLAQAVIDASDKLSGYTQSAQNSADLSSQYSQVSINAANISTSAAQSAATTANIYVSLSSAQAAITAGTIPSGTLFNVAGSNASVYVDQYLNSSGTPVYQRSLSSQQFVQQTNTIALNTQATTQGFISLPYSTWPIEECDQNGLLLSYYDSTGMKFYPGDLNTPILNTSSTIFSDGTQLVSNGTDAYYNPEIDLSGNLLWGTNKNTGKKTYFGRALFNSPGLLGNDFSAIGDSITARGLFNGSIKPVSWHAWASIYTNSQLMIGGIYATSGFTVSQVLATEVPLAIASPNSMCVVMCGRNDVIQGIDIANITIPAFIMIFNKLLMAGILPVVCTMSAQGNSGSSTQRIAEHTLNNWLRYYARSQGLPFVDLHAVTVDPTTGDWLSGYNVDVSHPTTLGASAMGKALVAGLQKWVSPTLPTIAEEQLAVGLTNNILGNSLFYTLTGGSVPSDFTAVSAGTSSITTNPLVTGNVWHISNSGSYTKAVTLTPGTTMGFGFYVQSGTGSMFDCYIANGTSSSTNYLAGLRTWDQTISTLSYFYMEFIVPAGVTLGTIVINSGSQDLYIAQMGLFNITEY
jgi:lysophospholipase L1-like esterase